MRTLYHLPLCPFARQVRIVLAEKKLDFHCETEKVWERRPAFLARNPAAEVPVLVARGRRRHRRFRCHLRISGRGLRRAGADRRRRRGAGGGAAAGRLVQPQVPARGHPQPGRREDRQALSRARRAELRGDPGGRRQPHDAPALHRLFDGAPPLARRRYLLACRRRRGGPAQLRRLPGRRAVGDHAAAKEWYARVKSRPVPTTARRQHPGVPPPKHYADLDF